MKMKLVNLLNSQIVVLILAVGKDISDDNDDDSDDEYSNTKVIKIIKIYKA